MIGCLMLVLAAVQLAVSNEYLLPGDVVPIHYDVRLLYNVDHATSFPFYGVVDIQLKIKRTTSKIVLHALTYTIADDSIKLVGQNVSSRVSVVGFNTKNHMLTLQTDQELKAGESYTLVIPFFGNLKFGSDGVFISSYVHKVTKAREYLIATQFKVTSARTGFPCFDEPIYKATFKITIGHNKDYTAISNMPLDNSNGDNALEPYWAWDVIEQKFNKTSSDFVWDTFKNSLPMSTYLVAFLVSKFQYVDSPPSFSKTKFRIWTRSDAVGQAAFAATLGPKVLSFYEDWFNVSFPLPKQDVVAVPALLNEAVENWGLIMYKDNYLYDEEESPFFIKEIVAEVIAHELAHHWFGNLVTMKWWSDFWLNEGFAGFMATVALSAMQPIWKAGKNHIVVYHTLSVLSLDNVESSHPISVPVENPAELFETFDEISYHKGPALIRMLDMFLGESIFRKALYNYLTKNSYQNAGQDDLWTELTEVSKQYGGLSVDVTVKEVMDTWTTQAGYPLLTVHRDYSDGSLTILQKRYLSQESSTHTKPSWWVPLRILCGHEVGQDQTSIKWLPANEGVSTPYRLEHGCNNNQWVLFNSDMIAPYRVNYDKDNWVLLSQTLASDSYTNIPVLGRVQLVSDAFELAWTNILDYTTTLELARYLHRETEYLPLYAAIEGLGKIETVLGRTSDYGVFQKYVGYLIGETYTKIGGLATKMMNNKDDLESVKMQIMTSHWACLMKVQGCEENAIELFHSWMNTENPDENNPIPMDLWRTVYCMAVSRGSVQHWQFVLARMKSTKVAFAYDVLLHSLACTNEVWILAQLLEWTLQPNSEVHKQDIVTIFEDTIMSSVGFYIAKDFIYTRIDEISKVFSGEKFKISWILKVLLNQFTTQRELDEFLKWRSQNVKYLEDDNPVVQNAIESASHSINWLQRNRRQVIDKFREFTE